MTLLLFIKLSAAIVSVALAAGLLARDHELSANRLIAAFLLFNALWATLEFYLFQATEPAGALALFRWMTVGWMPMGLLCMHGSLRLKSMPDHPIARTIPYFYGAVAATGLAAVSTDWVIQDVATVPGGAFRPIFGPGFPVAYGLLAAPLVTILAVWRRMITAPGPEGESELAKIIFYGVSLSFLAASVTAIVLPMLGYEAIGVTTSLVTGVGLAVAWTLRTYGHSLISPEAFAREIFDTLDDGVVVLGDDGLVRDSNRAFRRMVGLADGEVTGRSIRRWIPDFCADPSKFEASTFMELRAESAKRLPIVISPPVELSARRRSAGHVFLIRDRLELVSLQRQLAVSGRLAAVGDLSRSISESIHQPAAATRTQLEQLGADWHAMLRWLESTGDPGQARDAVLEGLELIGECVEGIDRVTAIVQEVGSFSVDSRRGGFDRHLLAEIVESAVRIARVQAHPKIQIETRLDPDVEVMCHRSELERVVTNLLVNALHALESVDRDVAHMTVAIGSQGDRALLHVEDDGCGIAADVIERVFDPFFTTKPVGRGTGLGLAISYHIVRKHGGQIRVSSIQDRGTSVAVELPLLTSPAAEAGL